MHHPIRSRVLIPLSAGIAAFAFAACDRAGESQRLAEERAALEREKAELAAERSAALQAANDQERARLDADRAALEDEKSRMSAERAAKAEGDRSAALAAERERRMAAERRANEEAAARRDAEAREEAARTAQAAAASARDDERNIDFFYTALDPHGDWVQLDRYGFAFRPQAARDPEWRPYTAGGWVYTDYGWTWRSDEPFGWATYHYGRWARVPRLGWVWVPGSEWGPAWVSWRRSDDYIGWAPLPPDAWSSSGFTTAVDSYYDIGPGLYTFLRVTDFGEPTYTGRIVAAEQNVTIINQTVNVTKVVYQKVNNHVSVVNNGPDLTVINRASRKPVRRLTMERLARGAPQPGKIEGNVFRLPAPPIRNAKPVAAPKAVKGAVKENEVDRGWKEARGIEQKFRENSRKQAKQAEDAQRTAPLPVATPKVAAPVRPATPPTPRPERGPAPTPAPSTPRADRPIGRPATPPPSVGQPTPPPRQPGRADSRRENSPTPPAGFQRGRPTADRPRGNEGIPTPLPASRAPLPKGTAEAVATPAAPARGAEKRRPDQKPQEPPKAPMPPITPPKLDRPRQGATPSPSVPALPAPPSPSTPRMEIPRNRPEPPGRGSNAPGQVGRDRTPRSPEGVEGRRSKRGQDMAAPATPATPPRPDNR